MEYLVLKDFVIAGGLVDLNDKNIELREIQIRDGLIIHSCNDYDKSLEVIREASFNIKNKLKIITKVYYKYPDLKHRRFRSIYSQIEEQFKRLGFIPSQWYLQICCYCSLNKLISNNAQKFFSKIKYEFGIEKIFLETYPIYNFDYLKLKKLNSFYKGKTIFGFSGYQNIQNRIFDEKCLVKNHENSHELIFIGILGKGIQNKIIPKSYDSDFIDKNIIYFLDNIIKFKLIKGITNFSSLKQYENFNTKFQKLQNPSNRKFFNDNLKSLSRNYIFYFKGYDQYGGHFSIKDYFKKPKLILFQIKRNFISFIKALNFSNNFFG